MASEVDGALLVEAHTWMTSEILLKTYVMGDVRRVDILLAYELSAYNLGDLKVRMQSGILERVDHEYARRTKLVQLFTPLYLSNGTEKRGQPILRRWKTLSLFRITLYLKEISNISPI